MLENEKADSQNLRIGINAGDPGGFEPPTHGLEVSSEMKFMLLPTKLTKQDIKFRKSIEIHFYGYLKMNGK